MKTKRRKLIILYSITALLLLTFVLFTFMVMNIDVQPIGPEESEVGFAKLNGFIHNFLGYNVTAYHLTNILGVIPLVTVVIFGITGIIQLIKRKSLLKVDRSILLLAGYYCIIAVVYILFEKLVINFRPVIIDNGLEASYPSSHTLLAISLMPTAVMVANRLLKKKTICVILWIFAALSIAFIIVGRVIAGVHWITDIIGGIILGSALVMLYYSTLCLIDENK